VTGPAGTPSGRAAGSVAGSSAAAPRPTQPGDDAVAAQPPAAAEPPRAAQATSAPDGQPTAAPETDAGPADVAPAAGRRRRARPSWGLVSASLVVALLALAAVAALLFARPSQDDLRDSALEAARTYSASLTTYDASTFDEDVERVLRVATGDFREEYASTVEQLRPQIEQQRTVAVGTVVAAGVETLEQDRATVVVAVDQNITTGGQPARTEANRLRMTLVRREGSWRVEGVERL
jgi:Mce-associated membrane protein